jgi:hypothetical protein
MPGDKMMPAVQYICWERHLVEFPLAEGVLSSGCTQGNGMQESTMAADQPLLNVQRVAVLGKSRSHARTRLGCNAYTGVP